MKILTLSFDETIQYKKAVVLIPQLISKVFALFVSLKRIVLVREAAIQNVLGLHKSASGPQLGQAFFGRIGFAANAGHCTGVKHCTLVPQNHKGLNPKEVVFSVQSPLALNHTSMV